MHPAHFWIMVFSVSLIGCAQHEPPQAQAHLINDLLSFEAAGQTDISRERFSELSFSFKTNALYMGSSFPVDEIAALHNFSNTIEAVSLLWSVKTTVEKSCASYARAEHPSIRKAIAILDPAVIHSIYGESITDPVPIFDPGFALAAVKSKLTTDARRWRTDLEHK